MKNGKEGLENSYVFFTPPLLVWDLVQCELTGHITITQGIEVTLGHRSWCGMFCVSLW